MNATYPSAINVVEGSKVLQPSVSVFDIRELFLGSSSLSAADICFPLGHGVCELGIQELLES